MLMPARIPVTESLYLQKPVEADAEELYESILSSETDLRKWMVWLTPHYGLEDALHWIRMLEEDWEDGRNFAYLIRSPREHFVLGSVDIHNIEKMNLCGSLGYWIRSDQAGKGIAPRAARALCAASFAHAGLRRIQLLTAVDNLRSQMVAAKLGANLEGVLKRRLRSPGGQVDARVFALFPEDVAC